MSFSEYFEFYLDGTKVEAKKADTNEYWFKLEDGSWHHIRIFESNKFLGGLENE